MSLIQEFKAFASRGNVIDMAVGIIIGAAFGKIVSSFVGDVIMPPIGLLTGGVDFSRLKWILRPENPDTEAVEQVAVQYGAFINTVIQFVIVAWAVFLLVKLVNSIRRKEAEKPPEAQPAPSPTEVLLMEIRDQLKAQNGAGSQTPPAP